MHPFFMKKEKLHRTVFVPNFRHHRSGRPEIGDRVSENSDLIDKLVIPAFTKDTVAQATTGSTPKKPTEKDHKTDEDQKTNEDHETDGDQKIDEDHKTDEEDTTGKGKKQDRFPSQQDDVKTPPPSDRTPADDAQASQENEFIDSNSNSASEIDLISRKRGFKSLTMASSDIEVNSSSPTVMDGMDPSSAINSVKSCKRVKIENTLQSPIKNKNKSVAKTTPKSAAKSVAKTIPKNPAKTTPKNTTKGQSGVKRVRSPERDVPEDPKRSKVGR